MRRLRFLINSFLCFTFFLLLPGLAFRAVGQKIERHGRRHVLLRGHRRYHGERVRGAANVRTVSRRVCDRSAIRPSAKSALDRRTWRAMFGTVGSPKERYRIDDAATATFAHDLLFVCINRFVCE